MCVGIIGFDSDCLLVGFNRFCVASEFLIAISDSEIGFGVARVFLDCLFKIGKGVLIVFFPEENKSCKVKPFCGSKPFLYAVRFPFSESLSFTRCKFCYPFTRNGLVQVLSFHDLKSGNTNDFAFHIDHRAAA